jgi:predicted Zn-dependent protease
MRAPLGIALLVAALAMAGCASSGPPAKKKRTVLLSTEYNDVRVGKEASEQVISQIGLLDDPTLSDYVDRVGHKLLRGVHRGAFRYRFHIVDQTEPNAFALPGGQIFVSRGMLALLNSEDELACMLGHEITHVAHRHAAQQQALARHSNPLTAFLGGAGRSAAYSREAERDADQGGQRLCAAAGYSPMGMSTMLRTLDQQSRLQLGYMRSTGFFDSHPGSAERAAANAIRAGEIRWQRDPTIGDSRRALLAKTDGLPVGQRPETGVFIGSEFLHPGLGFKFRFPRTWRASNTAQAVGATAPRGDGVVFLRADLPLGDVKQVAEDWLARERESQRIDLEEAKPVRVAHAEGYRMKLHTRGGGRSLTAVVTFFPFGEATWRVMGLAPSSRFQKYAGSLMIPVRSFSPLEPGDADSIEALRLTVKTARSGEGIEKLSLRTDNAWDVLETAINNGVFGDHRFESGDLVKITQRERYQTAR